MGALCVALTSPAAVDLVCESVGVALGMLCVGPCCLDVAMGPVTAAAQPGELIARGGNGPGLSEQLPLSLGLHARKTVHASIEVVHGAAPPAECPLDISSPPVGARFRPLKGHVPAACEARFGGDLEVAPKFGEDRPVSANLLLRGSPLLPIKVLVWGSSCAWQRAKKEYWTVSVANCVNGFVEPGLRGEVVVYGETDNIAVGRGSVPDP